MTRGHDMSAHKTPYEIRLNLLELAHRIEKDKAHAASAQEFYESGNKEFLMTKAASLDSVVATAEELNKFVSKEQRGRH